ncbi:metallopeptidase family m24 domain-containing protein [Ditylenchus destructor]|nr:metallopeptidase family m24 domain-containing protein [Ditylenchus destructor]
MIIRRFFSTSRAIPITADEFRERRSKLVSLLSANVRVNNTSHLSNDYSPIAVLFSKRPTFAAREIPHNFRQCSYFRYLCGFDLPDKARLVITPKESILFRFDYLFALCANWRSILKDKTEHEILWEGPSIDNKDVSLLTGVDNVLPLAEFDFYLAKILKAESTLSMDWKEFEMETSVDAELRRSAQFLQGVSRKIPLLNEIDKLRWIKSPSERNIMRKNCRIGSQAINSVISQAPSVNSESAIIGLLEYEFRRRNAEASAYPPVVASGNNANTIHYIRCTKDLHKEDCLLLDAGCELEGYISDITRTFPLSGSYGKYKEIYDALNWVQSELLDYVHQSEKLRLNDLHLYFLKMLSTALESILFFKKNFSDDEMIQECNKLCPHHVSHYLGMDVHDTPSIARGIVAEPGVVITVEPGIYVRKDNSAVRDEFKGIGLRIEDDVLITESGSEVLTNECLSIPS